ncbi:hypothetical protein O6H91_03G077300 [Diphasiastrum complanatum]|uniref:Uncharacterized protein n=2 Tax=Diphasiastrum complanatum TaxID=34168 RepID=A0ACC2E8D2_DIPCM|nr:hypothetical protein O6H91_03G077300 [Diphasiastrum complanatum]KAJ7562616.1 hypothetical protein O6H91_03G077300 [Diphasiastrum complanatum]
MNKYTDLWMMHSNVAAHCETHVCDQEELKCLNGCSSMLDSVGVVARNKAVADAQGLHQLKASLPQTSQRRFFFVDYSEGKSSMYFHPSMLKDLSGGTLAEDMSDLPAVSGENIFPDSHPMTNMVIFDELQRDDSLENEMALLAFKRAMTSAFAALYEMLNSRERLMFLNEMRSNPDSLIPFINAEARWTSKLSWESNDFAGSDVSNSSLLNDTDDLEAFLSSNDEASTGESLLSFDDEASTGQSPGDNIWVSKCESPLNNKDKRTDGVYDQINECNFEDTDGESTVICFAAKESDLYFPSDEQVSLSDLSSLPTSANTEYSQLPEEAVTSSTFSQSKQLGVSSSSSEFSSSDSAKRKHSVYSLPVRSSSAKKSRNDHIKRRVRLLRNVIPGVGDHMDTAAAVDEAICYVTSLQQKVQELEECRQFGGNH